MTVEQAFSRNLKQILKDRKMTQRKLVQDTGLGRSTIDCILRQGRGPCLYTAYKIASVLDLMIDDLLEGCDE